MKKYRILITYVEAGMGHIVSAEALANALEKYYPDEVEIIRSRIFTETNDPVLIKHEKFLINSVKRSNRNPISMYFIFLLSALFSPNFSLTLAHNTVFRREKKKLIEIMNSYKPDMVISTHFTPLHASIEAKRKGAKFKTVCYDPDPNVHRWWDTRADLFLVNNEAAYQEALKKDKFNKDNLFLGRFILRKDVLETKVDKIEMRKKYGLPLDNFTIIMADGAYAKANLKSFAEEFLKIDRKFTLLIIAGKNEKLLKHFNEISNNYPNITIKVYGFMKDIYELYCASNIFVTKAGPNAILDSVYMETPIMVSYYASPIEEITKNLYVKTYGVGVYEDSHKKAGKLITQYIDNPELLNPYIENCKKFKKEGTGEKIMADRIMDELHNSTQQ